MKRRRQVMLSLTILWQKRETKMAEALLLIREAREKEKVSEDAVFVEKELYW